MPKRPEPSTLEGGQNEGPETETGPFRTCIVTREKKPEAELIRFVFSPEGAVVPDLKHKLPGRGAYVAPYAGTVAEAVRKGAFSRSFKRKVSAGEDLPALVEELMCRDALNLLSLANKAGQVVTGYEKLEAESRRRPFAFYLHAVDASEQGLQKLARLATSGEQEGPFRLFDVASMSEAVGRENAVNLGIKPSALADALRASLARLKAYRAG